MPVIQQYQQYESLLLFSEIWKYPTSMTNCSLGMSFNSTVKRHGEPSSPTPSTSTSSFNSATTTIAISTAQDDENKIVSRATEVTVGEERPSSIESTAASM